MSGDEVGADVDVSDSPQDEQTGGSAEVHLGHFLRRNRAHEPRGGYLNGSSDRASGQLDEPLNTSVEEDELEEQLGKVSWDDLSNSSSPPVGRGSMLGRYLVLGELGRGAMGTVLEAHDADLNRPVAIKLLHDHISRRHTARLRREAQAMATLSHPNVVQVYEVGEADGYLFVAMELVKGLTVLEWMSRLPRPSWKACVEIFIPLGEGLAAAHEQGLVHRDFKPSNAIIDDKGRPRVLDFGLARSRDDVEEESPIEIERGRPGQSRTVPLNESLTKTGDVLGTPAYMPLEQMLGQEADARSDQFSFCVSLYEAVYGERPFEGRMSANVVLEDERIPAPPKGSKVPAALRVALLRGLSNNPEQRWSSMDEILGQLRRLVTPRRWGRVALTGLVLSAVAGSMVLQQRCELSVKDDVIEDRESRLAQRVEELAEEKRSVAKQLAIQKGLRSKMLAEDAGRELEALRLAIEAFDDLEGHHSPVPAPVFEGLTYALTRIHRGITMRGHENEIYSIAVSPDGHVVATASLDETVRVWELYNGALVRTIEGHDGPVSSVVFSTDGKRLATGGVDRTARIWDVATGQELQSYRHGEAISSVAFSPDGTRLAAASGQDVWVWFDGPDVITVPLSGHRDRVRAVQFSPDGLYLLTASHDHTVRIWDVAAARNIRILEGHTGPIYDVAISRDGGRVVTASSDGTARSWDVATGRSLGSFTHNDAVRAVALSPDGTRLATGTFESGTARLWDLATSRSLETYRHRDAVLDVAFSPDGRQLVTASVDLTARSWNLEPGAIMVLPHDRRVDVVAFSPDGSTIATGSGDGNVRIWHSESGSLLMLLKGHRMDILALNFSPDGSILATASWDGTTRLWDAHSGANRTTLRVGTEPVYSVAFSADGERLVTASRDGLTHVWSTTTGEKMYDLAHESPVRDAFFAPKTGLLVTLDERDRAYMWDSMTGAATVGWLTHFVAEEEPITAVAFSSSGRRIAIAAKDYSIHVWDANSGAVLPLIQGHTAPVRSLAFSNDGRLLVTGSEDGTARVWTVRTGEQRAAFPHVEPVASVAFSSDGNSVATASGDDGVRVWTLDEKKWISWGCRILGSRYIDKDKVSPTCRRATDSLLVPESGRSSDGRQPVNVVAEDMQKEEAISVQGVKLVLVRGGTFVMGSPQDERARSSMEGPLHEVYLHDFYMAQTELTNEQYARYLKSVPGATVPFHWEDERFGHPQQPVALTWQEAKRYCDWAGLMIPTEAQWEYAARAGTSTAYWFGDKALDLLRFGWYDRNTGFLGRGNINARTHFVATKSASFLGLYDMYGNLYEWTLDVYAPYSDTVRSGDGLHIGPSDEDFKAIRGGYFGSPPRNLRSAFRTTFAVDVRWPNIGLRPVLRVDEAARLRRAAHRDETPGG